MNNIDIKYPFEPLPPPEHPSARYHGSRALKAEDKHQSVQVNGKESWCTRDVAFNRVLQRKTEALSGEKKVFSEEEEKKIRNVARDMEAFFVYMILKSFTRTMSQGGFFGKQAGSSMYMDMFCEGVAEQVARAENGFGLAEQIEEAIKMSKIL